MNDSASEKLECVVRETGPDPRHAVIWLHGLGADGHDFEPIVPHLQSTTASPTRFIFPHATVRPVTVNGGMAMRAWYDILGLSIDRDQDRDGILASVRAVDRIIDEQITAGISPDRIVLAGFSQGGAIALRCGLARSEPLAGIVALSCYLLDAPSLSDWADQTARTVPIYIGHGTQDPVVPMALGQAARASLEKAGFTVSWQTWPMAHAVCAEEIASIDQWLEARFR